MMRVFVAIVLLFLPVAAFAQTEKRVALLIGNSFQTAFASGIARELQKHVAILEREITVQPQNGANVTAAHAIIPKIYSVCRFTAGARLS